MDGIFVTGTDTNVGKTVVSGGLVTALYPNRKPHYWKPVQTGTLVGDDTRELKQLCGVPEDAFLEPLYTFPEPVSPHLAAEKWNRTIDPNAVVSKFQEYAKKGFLVVEGAGGVLVPLGGGSVFVDVAQKFGVPTLVVSEDRLGAINHTLLTLGALKARGMPVLAVVLTSARGKWGNAESIRQYGKVEVIEVPPCEDARQRIRQVSAHAGIRKLLGLAEIPLE